MLGHFAFGEFEAEFRRQHRKQRARYDHDWEWLIDRQREEDEWLEETHDLERRNGAPGPMAERVEEVEI